MTKPDSLSTSLSIPLSTPLWTPTTERIRQSQIYHFQKIIAARFALTFANYSEFHRWSIDNPEDFWESLWQFCDIHSSSPYSSVLSNPDQANDSNPFFTSKWFDGSRLNFAENLLRFRDDKTALVSLLENGQRSSLSYAQLFERVAQLAAALRKHGVKKGDRIAGFMPNIPQTVIAMLATSSIGAIWSSCSPDFGLQGAVDRFSQIAPKMLFAADGYFYKGKTVDSIERLQGIQSRISSIEKLVIVPLINSTTDISTLKNTVLFDDFLLTENTPALHFEQLPFDHPLYVMYSSGTTGIPKCIVHGAGGTLLQHLKELKLHTDIKRDDVLFYYTTCGWMMWNWLISGLACGCTLVLYDGDPFANEAMRLLDAIDIEGITVFGCSARYITALEKKHIKPGTSHQLKNLKTILSTGSPLSHESFDYIYREFKKDLCVSSISGGTDIISCFALGNPALAVYRGELQCIGLGMAVEFWNEQGKPVREEKGELVCTRPFPSCPVKFWNDPDNSKFHDAYFAVYENIWAHGDYGEITRHDGVIIHGRSDAILNPGGIRIGSAEIYRQVEKIDAVVDSIVVGQQWRDDVRIILFVVLRENLQLDDALKAEICRTIKNHTTPRHVPAKIIQVADIPRTISGKIAELAVKNTIHNQAVKNSDALANPQALKLYQNLSQLQS
jgi:acetoacetyl-CoA synthetase